MKNNILAVGIIAALTLTACQTAEQSQQGDSGPVAEPSLTGLNEAQLAYTRANARMHAGMGVIDKDADVAFIQGMIPHHQGAVDMANIILKHGDDEEAKTLARNIITAQEEEIAWMRGWLKERGLQQIDVEAQLADGIDHQAMGH